MTDMRFVDTNVLLYAASTVAVEVEKRRRAAAILEAEDLAVSVQVLQEFYVQATRDTREDRLSHRQAVDLIEAWMRYPVQEFTIELMRLALASKERWRISYWDAAIVEAARMLGCDVLLSEDLQDGMDFAGVRIQNPFIRDGQAP
jgi:predicted nucleic acid-binding protein